MGSKNYLLFFNFKKIKPPSPAFEMSLLELGHFNPARLIMPPWGLLDFEQNFSFIAWFFYVLKEWFSFLKIHQNF